MSIHRKTLPGFLALLFLIAVLTAGTAWAQVNPPAKLADVALFEPLVVEPLGVDFLNGATTVEKAAARAAAIALGKALLWDMQVGSDGKTACASCHSRAGVDHRSVNTLHPGANGAFNVVDRASGAVITPASGLALTGVEFPFHQRDFPELKNSKVVQDYDDVVGSQGVKRNRFDGLKVEGGVMQAAENGTPVTDPVFGNNRRVTGRNAPTYINAAFNFTMFHDGRANNVYNGVNPFGPEDPNAMVWADNPPGTLVQETLRVRHAALASQALGPPLSTVEMSYEGRTFAHIGKKLLDPTIKPLGQQEVHANDSVFGPGNFSALYTFRDALGNIIHLPLGLNIRDASGIGLNTTYADLVKLAFNPRYWQNSSSIVINGEVFSQMEANFSLFFGLAVQLYEMTLISDKTKFDLSLTPGSGVALDAEENQGLDLFQLNGCSACHIFPEFTAHAQRDVQLINPLNQNPFAAIGREQQIRFGFTLTDEGIYNIAVRPTGEDVGRGGKTQAFDTRPKPAFKDRTFPLSFTLLWFAKQQGILPPGLAEFVPDNRFPTVKRTDMVQGAFKVATLRNIALTGPYFHNGSVGTLAQVLDFYTRGANFPKNNAKNLHPAIVEQTGLQGAEQSHRAIIAFLKTLTDERVRQEEAPFDHPQLKVPHWVDPDGGTVTDTDGEALGVVPAVGAGGRTVEFLQPVEVFLNLNNLLDSFVPAP